MTTLLETIKQRKPIKVYLREDDKDFEYFDTYEYNEKLNRYEGAVGNIPMEKMPEVIKNNGKEHIKLEVI